MRRHLGFIIFFTFTIAVFLGSLIPMKSAFLGGDYMVQFYPWSKVYSESIKNFQFPFWTRYFHSGFPLMAEGQIGGFYPLNIIMFMLLPFNVAYNYSVVLHFVLAGLFTYCYCRKIGSDQWGGSLAALLFCFGSAYAGCFYNTVTLKTLVWFPVVLLLFEKFLDSKKVLYLIIGGAIAGIQFLAGFIQMAAYSLLFYIVYLIYGFRLRRFSLGRGLLYILIFALLVMVTALPQLLLTYGLSQYSDRSEASLGFALWRSFPPPCLLSAFFPYWFSFLGHQFFIGTFSILFLIYALTLCRDSSHIRPLILIGILATLAAFGRYNPLYVAILNMTKFYAFRNPSKFLFFALFACSVLAGFSFSKFFKSPIRKLVRISAIVFSVISAFSLSMFIIARVLLPVFKDSIIEFLRSYVMRYVFGRPYHRYSLDAYLYKIQSVYQSLIDGAGLDNIFVLFSVAMIVLGIFVALYIYFRPHRLSIFRASVFCIIFLDIYVYSFYGTGFRGNIKRFEYLKPTHTHILQVLKADKELFRFAPFGLLDDGMPWWTKPNANILEGLDNVAAYSPLVKKGYRDKLLALELVDNSLGLLSPSDGALLKSYQSLRILNVKYIISARDFNYNFLEKAVSNNGVFLYRLKDYLPRVFFTPNIEDNLKAQPVKSLNIIEYRSGFITVDISADKDGFLVFSESCYPGWKAFVDDKESDIVVVGGLIQAVYINRGKHRVVFRFDPVL